MGRHLNRQGMAAVIRRQIPGVPELTAVLKVPAAADLPADPPRLSRNWSSPPGPSPLQPFIAESPGPWPSSGCSLTGARMEGTSTAT